MADAVSKYVEGRGTLRGIRAFHDTSNDDVEKPMPAFPTRLDLERQMCDMSRMGVFLNARDMYRVLPCPSDPRVPLQLNRDSWRVNTFVWAATRKDEEDDGKPTLAIKAAIAYETPSMVCSAFNMLVEIDRLLEHSGTSDTVRLNILHRSFDILYTDAGRTEGNSLGKIAALGILGVELTDPEITSISSTSAVCTSEVSRYDPLCGRDCGSAMFDRDHVILGMRIKKRLLALPPPKTYDGYESRWRRQ